MSEVMIVEEIEDDENGPSELGTAPATRVIKRVQAPPKAAKKAAVVPPSEWPRIKLEESDNIPPVGLFIGYNGEPYLLRPGVETAVPPGILEILNNAITTVPRIDPQTLKVVGWRDRLRYPYTQVQRRAA